VPTDVWINLPAESSGSSGVTSLNGLTGILTLVPGTGISITPSGSMITIAATGGSGTVTSVGLSLPTSVFTVSGSPVTTSGTLTGSFTSQSANTFFAAPNGSAGTPVFRLIVPADIPTLNQNTTGTAGNITATTNSTLVTLSSLSLPYSQLTGVPPISGFTQGSVLFAGASGQISQDNPNFYWNDSNLSLGLGVIPASNIALDIVNSNGTSKAIQTTSYGTGSSIPFRGRFARGTSGSPAAAQSGDNLSVLSGRGYGTSQFATASTGAINIVAGETFTNTSNATYMQFEVTPSGSTTLSEAMRIASTGYVGIGITTPGSPLTVQETTTQIVSDTTTSLVTANFNPTANTTTDMYGLESDAQTLSGNTFNISGNLEASLLTVTHNGSGVLSNAVAVDAEVYMGGTGTITNATCLSAYMENDTAGNITNAYGVFVSQPGVYGSGNFINTYGLYLETQNVGTGLNYSIYSQGGQSYFAGNVGIGVLTPATALEISGTLRLDGSTSGYLGFHAPATVTTPVTWTLPNGDGANGQALTTNGSGVLSWVTPASFSGLTTDGVIYATSSNTVASTAIGTNHYVLTSNGAGAPTFQQVSLTTGVTGILPVANGGTSLGTLTSGSVIIGAGTSAPTFVAPGTAGNVLTNVAGVWTSSAATGFSNPMTTLGDMIYENSTPAPARLPIGTAGQVLTVSGGIPTWTTLGGGTLTIGSYDGQSPVANGLQIVSNALYAQSATTSFPGMVNTTTQSFAGNKTFTGNTVDTGNTSIANATASVATIGIVGSTAVQIINGGISYTTRTVTASFTIDTTTTDYYVLCNQSAAITITLPAPTNGRTLIIKDISGTANTNNITVARHASELIEGIAASKIIQGNYDGETFMSDGTNWWLV
jgi:hypothetical protein